MALLTVKQLRELKNKKSQKDGNGEPGTPVVLAVTPTIPLKSIEVDETLTTQSERVWAKRLPIEELEVNSVTVDKGNWDGFHAPPQPLPKPEE